MRRSWPLLYLLSFLLTTTVSIAAPSSLSIREEISEAPLIDVGGLSLYDVHQGDGDSSWFHSVAVALLHSRPDDLQKCWTVDGKPGDKVSEAEFHLYDKKGEKKNIKMNFKDVREKKAKADVQDVKKAWWIAGLQLAALQMGGYVGLQQGSFGPSVPEEAFKMLTNKEVAVYNVPKEKNYDDLWTLLTFSAHTPTVFSVEVEDGVLFWYAALSATVNEELEGDKLWEKGELEIYRPNGHVIDTYNFADYAHNILSVVHWEFD